MGKQDVHSTWFHGWRDSDGFDSNHYHATPILATTSTEGYSSERLFTTSTEGYARAGLEGWHISATLQPGNPASGHSLPIP